MGNRTSTKSAIWFDYFPTEIFILIFEYLSTNDILYTFFHLNDRLKDFLLENHNYSTYFELPKSNLNFWRKIVPLISSRIECLHINTIYFPFPLNSFSNVKSIIISSSHGFADEELKSILMSEQFQRLETFRIISNDRSSTCYDNNNGYFNDHYQILNEVLTNRTSLKIFEYSFVLPPLRLLSIDHYEMNCILQSLTLILTNYEDIFSLVEYTPHLNYLNIQSKPLSRSVRLNKKLNLKLERFQLRLTTNHSAESLIDFDQLMNNIQPFSSSLICLSLNLADLDIFNRNQIPFDFVKLKQWLESMLQLKQFHFYAKLIEHFNINRFMPIELQNWFWLEHNLLFGMHGNYLYTLPFHFDHLHLFPSRFQITKSNHFGIQINNSQLWYKVKSIQLDLRQQYHTNFIHDIKMKLPNLSSIRFLGTFHTPKHETLISFANINEGNDTDTILDKLTTINFSGLVEREREWLTNSLPNLRYLILSAKELSSLEFSLKCNQFRLPFQLENDLHSIFKQLDHIDHIYFSNIKHITISLNDRWTLSTESIDLLLKILKQSKHLQTILIYISRNPKYDEIDSTEEKLHKFLDRLSKSKLRKTYEIKCFRRYCFIFKVDIR